MDNIEPNIPSTASMEDVLRWTLFYINGFANSVDQMTEVLATEAHVEAHPKAIVTLRRRAAFMHQYSDMLKGYLDAQKQPPEPRTE